MLLGKLKWIFKRHPFLYIARFKLLSHNADEHRIGPIDYNRYNPKSEIPNYFHDVNALIFKANRPENTYEVILQLSIWLQQHIKGGPGLSYASDIALKKMLSGQGGVCSDRVQIFNNFCVLNDIQVREWGVTCIPFDKSYGGHSFNEVYIEDMQKWVAIDVSYCGMFYEAQNDLPLSVIELFKAIREHENISFKAYYSSKDAKMSSIEKNYFYPKIAPFLISQYNNVVYDTYLKRYRGYLPVFVIHFLIYLSGKSYRYMFPMDDYKKIFA